MQEGRARSNPWGATYRAAPEILHGACAPDVRAATRGQWAGSAGRSPKLFPCAASAGYTKKVKGDTAEERLDMRAATKADRYCK